MGKPSSLPGMFGAPTIIVGFMFIASAYFRSSAPTEAVEGLHINTIMIFPALGFCCVLAGIALVLFGQEFDIRRRRMRHRGEQVQGQVTDVKTLGYMRYIRFGRKPPKVVHYTYPHDGEILVGKSELLWEDPQLSVDAHVTVCVDGYKPQRSAIVKPGSQAARRAAEAAEIAETAESVEW